MLNGKGFRNGVGHATGLALVLAVAAPGHAAHSGTHDARVLAEDPAAAVAPIAPVLDGVGDLHFEVTTTSKGAQRFFDQGLNLTFAFNHKEALRSFKEAARLDPGCAMAYWGWALVLGPNLNLPMQEKVVAQAWKAIRKAMALADRVTPRERAYIDALATRYTDDPDADRRQLDEAYAAAMAQLQATYPDDDTAATLYAAALMNLSPWNYWTKDGRPRSEATEITTRVLERVIERNPAHLGALHYYIHVVEEVAPERAERAADLLRGRAPGAGHLVHMPSHIYMWTGRYGDAVAVNLEAVEADEGYITQCSAQGMYPLNYYPHNLHFLVWAATMQGRSTEALAVARKVASQIPPDLDGDEWARYESLLAMPLDVMVRFGRWQEILAEPKPPRGTRYWTGLWHYARGMAFAHTGRAAEGAKELAALAKILEEPASHITHVARSRASIVLQVAHGVLAGLLESRTGRYDRAISRLDRAVRLEDGLPFSEPPGWYTPSRHYLGAVLLAAGRADEAESVFWQDLAQHRENGFALHGLARALDAQGRQEEAAAVRRRFEAAWKAADVELESSAF